MEVTARPAPAQVVVVEDGSAVGEVRRAAQTLATRLGFDEARVGRATLAATEMATNLVKHGGPGEVVLQGRGDGPSAVLELIALDRGAGIADPARSMEDGVSTRQTPGTGLGAIRRAAGLFDLYSQANHGTAVLARLSSQEASGYWSWGGLAVALPGESVPGDAWAVVEGDGTVRVLMADGLGHGPQAAEAARAAVDVFLQAPTVPLTSLLEDVHRALRATRGAAASVAEVDARKGEVRFAGVGNVAATLWSPAGSRSLVSLNGTLGMGQVRVREFSYPWTSDCLLVLATDGLKTHWSLAAYPGLPARDPALVSAVLYRDHNRGRDDVSVVALRARTAGRP